MSPAKKKKAVKRKPKPPPVVPPVPPPVLTAPQRRFFKVIQTKNLIGGVMFLLGVGFCVGFWVSDKAHDIEKFVLGVGVFLIIAGAHFMSSEPTERFLKAAGGAAKDILPFTKKSDPPPPPAGGQ
jgi:hypothetical protein